MISFCGRPLEELLYATFSMGVGEDCLYLKFGHFHFPAGGTFPLKHGLMDG
jgi:hypothetical protein